MSSSQVQTQMPFVITENTIIGFGKLKGKTHLMFQHPEFNDYAKWIVAQGEDFRYHNTRQWIINNVKFD